MTNEARQRERCNNTRRLVYALYQRSEDAAFIQQLASLLHYMPEQLKEDISDAESYTAEKVREDSERETV